MRELEFSEVPYLCAQRLHADNVSISTIEWFQHPTVYRANGDVSIVCNARYLDDVFQDQYAHDFIVPLSTHVNGTAPMVSNVMLAALLQSYSTRF